MEQSRRPESRYPEAVTGDESGLGTCDLSRHKTNKSAEKMGKVDVASPKGGGAV